MPVRTSSDSQIGSWQPIETYTPNGKDVLLFDGEHQFVGKMALKVSHTFAPVEKIVNWFSWDGLRPTHWMPLPGNPSA